MTGFYTKMLSSASRLGLLLVMSILAFAVEKIILRAASRDKP